MDPTADAATVTWEADGEALGASRWIAVIVVHPDPQWIGRRTALAVDVPLILGRACTAFGDGALEDAHTSRAHAELRWVGDEGVDVVDLGSHNGTVVDGAPVVSARVNDAGLVGIGRIVIALERDVPPPDDPIALPELVGDSGQLLRVVTAATTLAARGRPVHVVGEPGVGKAALVRAIHDRVRSGPWVRVTANDPSAIAAAAASAAGGTLLVERVERAEDSTWAALLGLLDVPSDPDAPWIALSSRAGPHEPLAALRSPHVRARIAASTLRIAPLRRRRSDLAQLVHHIARRYAGDDATLDGRLVLTLLRQAWRGNVRELDAVIERIAIESPQPGRLVAFDGLDELLGVMPRPEVATATHGPRPEPFVVGADGLSFTTPDGSTPDLSNRRVLARVLAALLESHHGAPGSPVAVSDLLRTAWPGERFQAKAGANRVYVALTTLRRMGLRELIARVDGGYAIDPNVALRIVR
jgi:hypothetical protein